MFDSSMFNGGPSQMPSSPFSPIGLAAQGTLQNGPQLGMALANYGANGTMPLAPGAPQPLNASSYVDALRMGYGPGQNMPSPVGNWLPSLPQPTAPAPAPLTQPNNHPALNAPVMYLANQLTRTQQGANPVTFSPQMLANAVNYGANYGAQHDALSGGHK